MNSDFERLCKAAEKAGAECGCNIFSDVQEAIVRAVLTELRTPGKTAIEAGAVAFDDAVDRSYDSDGNGTMRPCIGLIRGYQTDVFLAMINSLLDASEAEEED